jgi:DNA polymerase III subunit epsilon
LGQLHKETFICIDCEATGLDPEKDRIIEIAVAKFTFDSISVSFESLIDPEMIIPGESIKIHHITQEMVQGKPRIQTLLPKIIEMIGSHTIIGHGILFDIKLLLNEAKRYLLPCPIEKNKTIDTLRLARLYGDSPTNALATLGLHFNVSQDDPAHRAMNDVLVNIEVFKHLSRRYGTLEKVFQILSKPVLMKTMPLGPHKGRLLKEIPLQYLLWAVRKDFDQDLLFSLKKEISERNKGQRFGQSANPFNAL